MEIGASVALCFFVISIFLYRMEYGIEILTTENL